jgi:hypothetical protein
VARRVNGRSGQVSIPVQGTIPRCRRNQFRTVKFHVSTDYGREADRHRLTGWARKADCLRTIPLRTWGSPGNHNNMDAIPAFEALAASLIGKPISHLWRGFGSAVFFEFGDLTPTLKRDGLPGNPEGQVSLGVEWSWRIEDDTKILAGSWSDEKLWEPAFALLRAARIERLNLIGRLAEIGLATDQGVHFISFSTTDGQPQWHLVDRRLEQAQWITVRNGKLYLGDGSEPAL